MIPKLNPNRPNSKANKIKTSNSLVKLGIGDLLEQKRFVAGVDEAGRGPLAGPVVAAACILPDEHTIKGIDDSKKLSPSQRKQILGELCHDRNVTFAIGVVDQHTIDKINILQGALKAMKLAIDALAICPDFLLVDGTYLPKTEVPGRAIPKGDTLFESIAAASIIAKNYRDELMRSYHKMWPQYQFDRHKGYPTKLHLDLLQSYGPSPIHRRSFGPVRAVLTSDQRNMKR